LGGTGPRSRALTGRRRSLGLYRLRRTRRPPAARSGLDGVGGGRGSPTISSPPCEPRTIPLCRGVQGHAEQVPSGGADDDGFAVEAHVGDPMEASREPSSLPPLSTSLRWNRSGSSLSRQGRGPSVAARVRRTARATAWTTSSRAKIPTSFRRGSTTGSRSTPRSPILRMASVRGSSTHATMGPALMTSRTHRSVRPRRGRRKTPVVCALGALARRSASVTMPINRPASRTGAPPTP